jgi:hypothetical protein
MYDRVCHDELGEVEGYVIHTSGIDGAAGCKAASTVSYRFVPPTYSAALAQLLVIAHSLDFQSSNREFLAKQSFISGC